MQDILNVVRLPEAGDSGVEVYNEGGVRIIRFPDHFQVKCTDSDTDMVVYEAGADDGPWPGKCLVEIFEHRAGAGTSMVLHPNAVRAIGKMIENMDG